MASLQGDQKNLQYSQSSDEIPKDKKRVILPPLKGGWVVRIFHLFCPRLYVGFQLNNTKGESNKYMPTHSWALQGSGVCHSH